MYEPLMKSDLDDILYGLVKIFKKQKKFNKRSLFIDVSTLMFMHHVKKKLSSIEDKLNNIFKKVDPPFERQAIYDASSLLNDMVAKGASDDELEKGIRYCLFVFNAEKNGIDYSDSEMNKTYSKLRNKYQKIGGFDD